LGANLRRAIVTNGDLLSQRVGPLPKLLWADLSSMYITHITKHAKPYKYIVSPYVLQAATNK